MKHLTLAFISIGLSLPALAFTPASTHFPDENSIIVLPAPDYAFAPQPVPKFPGEVTLPPLSGGFAVGLTGTYLRPAVGHGDLQYAIVNPGTPLNTIQQIDPSYYWGWGVNVGYAFNGTSNDVNFNYSHYDADYEEIINNNNPTFTPNNIIPFNTSNPTLFPFAHNQATFTLDQVDLTGGQYVDIGSRFELHPILGVRWSDLQRTLDGDFSKKIGISTLTERTDEKSDFSGIGPLLGTDAAYSIGDGFGLVGHADAGVIIGSINSKTTNSTVITVPIQNNTNNQVTFFSSAALNNGSRRRIVPVVGGKVAADYTYAFDYDTNATLTVEAGYQFDEYFNIIDRIYISNGALETTDLSFDGPYVNVTYHTI